MIRRSTRQDIIDCCDDHVAGKIDPYTVDISNFTTVEHNDHKSIFLVLFDGNEAEIHTICPKKSLLYCRLMSTEMIYFLRRVGVTNLYTIVLKEYKKAYNMALKLGFEVYDDQGHQTFFRRVLCPSLTR